MRSSNICHFLTILALEILYLRSIEALSLLPTTTFALRQASVLADGRLLLARDALCPNYTVQAEETCTTIAFSHGITTANLETYNSQTWNWHGCSNVKQGDYICIGPGAPPMPVALPHAICGPQVPGTARPKDMTTLASLNPCLSGDCCSLQGQCGTTANFCSATNCLSNCNPPVQKAGTKEATPHKTTTQKMTTTELTKPTTKPPPTTAAHTTVKSTPSTADPVLPTDYWHLDKYSDTKCGDQLSDAKDSGYYRIQGYKNANDVCFTLAGGNLSTDDSGLDLWCQWWPGEGADGYRNCDQSPPLEKPGSWRFTAGPSGGHCASFTDAKCTHEEQSATMGRGGTGCVKNTKAPGFGLGNKVFKSIKCGLGNYAYEDYT